MAVDAKGDVVDIYLMQHGEATTAETDPSRPLTPDGRTAVERVAARAAGGGVRVGRCVHSGKLRARQTAEVIAEALGSDVEAVDGLGPSDPVAPIADWLSEQAAAQSDEAIAIVGHLPFLDRLASLLVADDEDGQVLRFENAALVKLVPKKDAAGHRVAWILATDLA